MPVFELLVGSPQGAILVNYLTSQDANRTKKTRQKTRPREGESSYDLGAWQRKRRMLFAKSLPISQMNFNPIFLCYSILGEFLFLLSLSQVFSCISPPPRSVFLSKPISPKSYFFKTNFLILFSPQITDPNITLSKHRHLVPNIYRKSGYLVSKRS